jgi:hypothetical protein
MKPSSYVSKKYVSALIIFLFCIMSFPLSAADMKDYCIIPPYVKRDVKPNILILMDNAQIMGEAAYNDNYDSSKTYSGLYKPNLMYTYGSNTWEPDAAGIYSGNLLNWVTTSKYDLLQSILVGGKSTSRQTNVNVLVSMSNSWEKTLSYRDTSGKPQPRVCKFLVNNANVEIKDDTAGSCGYLDSPPYPLIASNENDIKYAIIEPDNQQHKSIAEGNILVRFMKLSSGFLSSFMDFLVPEAEAAANLRLPSGNTPAGTECTPYSASITASGGTETGYTWSITSGSLPAGLTMAATGTPSTIISGTPTVSSGTYNFTVRVCDSAGCINKHEDSKAYSITINDATVSITTSSPMPDGTVGSWYRSPVRAGGVCTGSTSWTQTAGSLPPGLSLGACTSGADCTDINGTPSSSGTYNFTLQVTDSKNNTATKSFSLTINPSAASFQIVTASPLTGATEGVSYLMDISTSGSSCGACCSCPVTYTWSITSGSLPAGLSFNTGGPCINGDHVYLTGTPTSTGTFSFTVQVTDCNGKTATKDFSLTISKTPPIIRTTGNLNVKICAGSYAANCNNADTTPPYDPPCSESYTDKCVLKTGIVDQFWPQARFGIEDFSKQASNAIPDISNCIEGNPGPEPDPDFMTAIENAIPIDPMTTLVNGAYTAIDYYANNTANNCNPFRNSQSCQRNFMLMISSGVGADNPPTPSGGTPDVFSDATNCTATNDPPASYNLAKNTCFGYSNDLRNSPTFGGENLPGRQIVSTYIVNTMGVPKDNDPGTNTAGDILYQAANAGGGVYYEVTDPATLREALIQAFQDILKRAAAGTAASVLASGEGSGANLVQAVFYPRRKVRNAEIAWTGRLTNFWFYVDPFFSSSSIYEDNTSTNVLNLSNDNRIKLFFDTVNEKTMAHRFPPSGTLPDIEFENLKSLWEAGYTLWLRNITSSPRMIKASIGGSVVNFEEGRASDLLPYLDLPTTDLDGDTYADGDINHDGSVNEADARVLIRYINGEDFPSADYPLMTWLRSRTVSFDSNGNGTIDAGETNVWKLGDILNSTPKVSSWIPLNNYDEIYGDSSYTAFLKTAGYQDRGMVYTGGNEGMLHAFKLGKLELKWVGQGSAEKARMTGSNLGEEQWAYIPKNVLPYLKFMKEPDYCHVYTIDLSPYVFDASIGSIGCTEAEYKDCVKYAVDNSPITSRWSTILIGGMRFGGACKDTCPDTDCVQNPATGLGYSSYFALDVTDQANPSLLWEFHDEDLGFTTTGPSIVRIGSDKNKNGKWFVVFGSGPTGPISTSDQQFLGRSNQNLRLFIFDLKTGPGNNNSNVTKIDTTIQHAFAGSMLNSTMDVDLDYQDDLVYIGYVKKDNFAGTWTQGGVGRIQTKESINPAEWEFSQVMDNVGPITSAVVRLLNKNKGQLWLYYGSGRYYFEQLSTVDDESNQRMLYGLKEPCYTSSGLNAACDTITSSGSLTDVTNTPDADTSAITNGWKINLDLSGNYSYYEGNPSALVTRNYRAERVITDPLSTSSGMVFFTSYKPYNDVCAFGGKSFIWAVKYNTGGNPGALLKGIALLQVSTGSIEQVDLSTAFTEKDGRRTSALEGVPPTSQGLALLSTPAPTRRVLHIKER